MCIRDRVDLSPLTGAKRSQAFIDLAGGEAQLAKAAQTALKEGKHRWAVELARELYRVEAYQGVAASIMVDGFRALAESSRSANGRNYYLTQAMNGLES